MFGAGSWRKSQAYHCQGLLLSRPLPEQHLQHQQMLQSRCRSRQQTAPMVWATGSCPLPQPVGSQSSSQPEQQVPSIQQGGLTAVPAQTTSCRERCQHQHHAHLPPKAWQLTGSSNSTRSGSRSHSPRMTAAEQHARVPSGSCTLRQGDLHQPLGPYTDQYMQKAACIRPGPRLTATPGQKQQHPTANRPHLP
jgi:hypothetical protein